MANCSFQLCMFTTHDVQVGSLSVGYTSKGDKRLLVSQPGGTYIPLCAGAPDDSRSVLCVRTCVCVCVCVYTCMHHV